MDLEESNKRKSPNLEEEGEITCEPSPKQQKIDDECHLVEPNLQNNGQHVIDKSTDTTPPNNETKQENPSITITFNDISLDDAYKRRFLTFLNTFADFKVDAIDNSIIVYVDKGGNPEEIVLIDDDEANANVIEEKPVEECVKSSKAKKELFVVDATPSQSTPVHLRYTTKFTVGSEKPEPTSDKSGLQSCFNCDGSHNLRDCKEPKNFSKINEARQKAARVRGSKSIRYHLDEEQKYAHLSPGKISETLRDALGLRKNELPHYVYLMRRMGYPPGWLEEARQEHSNLDMFGVDLGVNDLQGFVKVKGLDPKMIVDYPGFNVPPLKGTRDESRKYGVPPFSQDFSKEAMIKFFEEQYAKHNDIMVSCDMDLETPEKKKNVKPVENLETTSLMELQKEKRRLLDQLNEEPPPPDYLTVQTTCFGTPLIKSSSPYSALPNANNFSKDVSPVINFENLPNSTGKYEQMVDVLQKVRDTLRTIQNCSTNT